MLHEAITQSECHETMLMMILLPSIFSVLINVGSKVIFVEYSDHMF